MGWARKVLLGDAGDLLSRNSKVMGSLMVRIITGTPGTMLAPLLGDVTRDAGITGGGVGGSLGSYREILRTIGLLLGKPGAGWARPWSRSSMILRNAGVLLRLFWEAEAVSGAIRVLMEIWGSHWVLETLPVKFTGD